MTLTHLARLYRYRMFQIPSILRTKQTNNFHTSKSKTCWKSNNGNDPNDPHSQTMTVSNDNNDSSFKPDTYKNLSNEQPIAIEKVSQNLFLSGSIYDDPIESKSFVKPMDPNEKPFIFINEFTTFDLLPVVRIKFERRITRFYVEDYRGIAIDELSTDVTGLAEHLLSTAPAAEATAAILAHKLKTKKIERVRIQFDGNSQGRLPAVKGLFDGGIQILCLCDITQTDNIPRQRKPPRV